jgi:nicotinate-nucleotide pyrophosphorylase
MSTLVFAYSTTLSGVILPEVSISIFPFRWETTSPTSSGIATATTLMVKLARTVNSNVVVAGTRKTTPGLRLFEKYAMEVGGGDPHRYNLSDMVLIKDNHIALLDGIRNAVESVRKYVSFSKKIEVEVTSLKEAVEAYKAKADIILLDNMTPESLLSKLNNVLSTIRTSSPCPSKISIYPLF